jgi:hypothetical protein
MVQKECRLAFPTNWLNLQGLIKWSSIDNAKRLKIQHALESLAWLAFFKKRVPIVAGLLLPEGGLWMSLNGLLPVSTEHAEVKMLKKASFYFSSSLKSSISECLLILFKPPCLVCKSEIEKLNLPVLILQNRRWNLLIKKFFTYLRA